MYVNRLERKELDITKICFTRYNFHQYVSWHVNSQNFELPTFLTIFNDMSFVVSKLLAGTKNFVANCEILVVVCKDGNII